MVAESKIGVLCKYYSYYKIKLPIYFKIMWTQYTGPVQVSYYIYKNKYLLTILGALTALGISKGWPIKYYIKTFKELAKEAFIPQPLYYIPIFLQLSNLILLYLYRVYLTLYIKGALKRAFSPETNILEYSYTSS